MSVELVLNSVKQHCLDSSGDRQIWIGNSGTYHWNRGKTTANGTVNGVVRKLAGTSATGGKIWVVAGSFKILPNGTIVRWTGLSKKVYNVLNQISAESIMQKEEV